MNDVTFYNLLKDFFFEVYPIAKSAINNERYYISQYNEYPKLNFEDNGMPYIGLYGERPKDINSVFRSYSGDPYVDLDKYDSYNKCFKYINENDYFSKIIIFYKRKSPHTNPDLYIRSFLIDILERYYLLDTIDSCNEELLEEIYRPIEYPAFNSRLYIDISIPILCTAFDCDNYEINEDCHLSRISDDVHKSRIFTNSDTISDRLISAATHEFKLLRWYIDSSTGIDFIWRVNNENFFPVNIFDNFMIALKIGADINSGYAQILMYPHDWAFFYKLDLPQVHGVAIKKFPRSFENYRISDEVPILSQTDIERVCNIFNQIQNNDHSKIEIACKRLKYSFMREDNEDSILDSIIGLEVLLSDNERGEITHKLAMRLSKLISMFNEDVNPLEILKSIKDIYSYRSKIVHGSQSKSSSDPKSLSQKKQAEKEKSLNYKNKANFYLRTAIELLLLHPEFLDVKNIDQKMLVAD